MCNGRPYPHLFRRPYPRAVTAGLILRQALIRAYFGAENEARVRLAQARGPDRAVAGHASLQASTEVAMAEDRLARLERSGGVRTRAAQILGLTFRSLRYRLQKLGMANDTQGEADADNET